MEAEEEEIYVYVNVGDIRKRIRNIGSQTTNGSTNTKAADAQRGVMAELAGKSAYMRQVCMSYVPYMSHVLLYVICPIYVPYTPMYVPYVNIGGRDRERI
jgi:hypothetical protein